MLRHFRFILLPIFIGVAKQSQLAIGVNLAWPELTSNEKSTNY